MYIIDNIYIKKMFGKKTNMGFHVYYKRFQTVFRQLSSDKCKRQTRVTAIQIVIRIGVPM